jgi:hypothetical protein
VKTRLPESAGAGVTVFSTQIPPFTFFSQTAISPSFSTSCRSTSPRRFVISENETSGELRRRRYPLFPAEPISPSILHLAPLHKPQEYSLSADYRLPELAGALVTAFSMQIPPFTFFSQTAISLRSPPPSTLLAPRSVFIDEKETAGEHRCLCYRLYLAQLTLHLFSFKWPSPPFSTSHISTSHTSPSTSRY